MQFKLAGNRSRFQVIAGPAEAKDASPCRRNVLIDSQSVGGRNFTGCKAQTAFPSSRKRLFDNPESVFRRNSRLRRVVAKNLVDAMLADQREQTLMDIPELDLGRVLPANHANAVIGSSCMMAEIGFPCSS